MDPCEGANPARPAFPVAAGRSAVRPVRQGCFGWSHGGGSGGISLCGRGRLPSPLWGGIEGGGGPKLGVWGDPHPCSLPTRGRETCWPKHPQNFPGRRAGAHGCRHSGWTRQWAPAFAGEVVGRNMGPRLRGDCRSMVGLRSESAALPLPSPPHKGEGGVCCSILPRTPTLPLVGRVREGVGKRHRA